MAVTLALLIAPAGFSSAVGVGDEKSKPTQMQAFPSLAR